MLKISVFEPHKMTTRIQKRKAVAEFASGEFEASTAENIQIRKKEIISELSKILAANQKKMLKPIAPTVKRPTTL